MKNNNVFKLALAIVTVAISPIESRANPDDDDRLKENLVLNLVVEEESEILVDLELLIARTEFSIDHIIEDSSGQVSPVRFQGTLKRVTEDEFYLTYTYRRSVPIVTGVVGEGRQQISFRDVGWNSTALLTIGQEVMLLREPAKEHRVSIIRADARRLNKPEGGNGE